jgi:hypothetical protein
MNQGNQMVVCDRGVACPVSEIRVRTKTADGKNMVKIMKNAQTQASVLRMLDQQAALGNVEHTFLQDDMDIHALHVLFKAPFERDMFCLRDMKASVEQVFEVEIWYLLPA